MEHGEPPTRHEVDKMIAKAVQDLQERVESFEHNIEADKNDHDTKLRKWMQELIMPITEQGTKHQE